MTICQSHHISLRQHACQFHSAVFVSTVHYDEVRFSANHGFENQRQRNGVSHIVVFKKNFCQWCVAMGARMKSYGNSYAKLLSDN